MVAPVNKIIDCSVVDGPGNRTSIFFQECNFNCIYCHNPETINRCSHCGHCVDKCPSGALKWDLDENLVLWDNSLCTECDNCIKDCPTSASPRISWMTASQIIARLQKNLPFIRGITVSGGESTLQKDFLVTLFDQCCQMGLSCYIDSNGSLDFSEEPVLMSVTDGVMLDVKAFDADTHIALTGAANAVVLKNLRFLRYAGKLGEVRTVVADDIRFNSLETVDKTSQLLVSSGGSHIPYLIIAYRPFGVRGKFQNIKGMSPIKLEELKALALANGLTNVKII